MRLPSTIQIYRFVFHISALALILLVPMLLRPDPETVRRMPPDPGFINRWLIVSVATASLHFVNVYFLIPKYLKLGQYFKYLILLLAGFLLLTIIANELIHLFPHRMMPPMREGMGPPPRPAGGRGMITFLP